MTTFALVAPIEPDIDHLRAHSFDCVVAVDGGYAHLLSAQIECNAAVGDFDSLGYVPKGVHIVELPCRKDQTDMEEALDYAMSQGADAVVVYGALGGRMDFTLAFMQLLGEYAARGLDLMAVGKNQVIIPLWGEGRNHVHVPGNPQGMFSLLAMSDIVTGVCERNVSYELDDAELFGSWPLGVSNEFIGKPADISIAHGSALLFVPIEIAEILE